METMHAIKIVNYEKEYGTNTFKPYTSMEKHDVVKLKEKIAVMLGLTVAVSSVTLCVHIYESSDLLPNVNAMDDSFCLQSVFDKLSIDPSDVIYVDWDGFKDVDIFATTDLTTVFSDIWYPSSDDIFLIDPLVNWIVTVDHEGLVKFLHINK
jgi:hypothetical protein